MNKRLAYARCACDAKLLYDKYCRPVSNDDLSKFQVVPTVCKYEMKRIFRALNQP